MMATSSEFSLACANAGRIATCAMFPAPTSAYRTLVRSSMALPPATGGCKELATSQREALRYNATHRMRATVLALVAVGLFGLGLVLIFPKAWAANDPCLSYTQKHAVTGRAVLYFKSDHQLCVVSASG